MSKNCLHGLWVTPLVDMEGVMKEALRKGHTVTWMYAIVFGNSNFRHLPKSDFNA